MALISNLTANGDHTVILKGGNVPFVLGKKPETSESDIRYQLVSNAYVHGIMNGEASRRSPIEAMRSLGRTLIWSELKPQLVGL